MIAALVAGTAAALAAQQGSRRWNITSSVNVNGVEVARNGYMLGPNGSMPGNYGPGYVPGGYGYPQSGYAFPQNGVPPNGYAFPQNGVPPDGYASAFNAYPQSAPNGYGYPQNGGGGLPVNAAAVAVTGKISSSGGTPAVVSNNKVYLLPIVAPYIYQIEGYQEGVEITVEGYAAPDGGYMELSKLTLNGKVYFFLRAASRDTRYGTPNNGYGYAVPPGASIPPVNLYVSPPQSAPGNGY